MNNRVGAVLAVMAMACFIVAFVCLGWMKVPTENKDFLNTALIALISFVSTAFGYYLGSSQGSVRKNELLAPQAAAEVPATLPLGSAGFIRLPIMACMALLLMLLLTICGCAGLPTQPPAPDNAITPYAKAALGLKATKTTIKTTAKAVDALCSQGIMKQPECDTARSTYWQVKATYEAAKDALLLGLETGNMTEYDRQSAALTTFTDSLTKAVAAYK